MFLRKLIANVLLLLLLLACSPAKKTSSNGEIVLTVDDAPPAANTPVIVDAKKKYDPIQIRYSKELGVNPDELTNIRLYSFIDEWMGTPYKWGGTDKNGIDCSAFIMELLRNVYKIRIERTSLEQFSADRIERFASTRHLSEGDLVFFKTLNNNRVVTHVGIYLNNRIFVNSSSSKGVSLASMDDPYWKSCFVAAGRIRESAR